MKDQWNHYQSFNCWCSIKWFHKIQQILLRSTSSVSVVPVSLPVVVHGARSVERLPAPLRPGGSAHLPPPRGHGGQHGQRSEREGHERRRKPHPRRYRAVIHQYRPEIHHYWPVLHKCRPVKTSSFSFSVLITLVKSKALVTPAPQTEAKSLPSTSSEALVSKEAPSQPSEERPVRNHTC